MAILQRDVEVLKELLEKKVTVVSTPVSEVRDGNGERLVEQVTILFSDGTKLYIDDIGEQGWRVIRREDQHE